MDLKGWGNPGRVVQDILHDQMFGIMKILMDKERINGRVWNPELQSIIGETIDVDKASTVRHIIGFMKSIGVLYEDALPGGKVPNPDHCISPSGKVLYSLISMKHKAEGVENKEVMQKVQNMFRWFYANAFIYWYVRDTKIHVARTVLKAIRKHDYLEKIEWFILNTIVSETDNKTQEDQADKYIRDYRDGNLTLTKENIKGNVNSYNYWTQILDYSGLIIKKGNKIYMGKQFPELTEAILADDFLENLDVNDKFNLRM
jgi:hypothetical protein